MVSGDDSGTAELTEHTLGVAGAVLYGLHVFILFNLIQPHIIIIIIMIPLYRFANRGPQNPKQFALGPSWHQENASSGDKIRIITMTHTFLEVLSFSQ